MPDQTYIKGRHVPVAADLSNGVNRICEEIARLLTVARAKGFPTEHLTQLAELRVQLSIEGDKIGRLGTERFLAERRGEENLP